MENRKIPKDPPAPDIFLLSLAWCPKFHTFCFFLSSWDKPFYFQELPIKMQSNYGRGKILSYYQAQTPYSEITFAQN